MRTTIVLVALLAACGEGISGQDPHALATCDGEVGNGAFEGEVCELACATDIATSVSTCAATYVEAGATIDHECQRTFEFDGVSGCCVAFLDDQMGGAQVVFAECE